ncbi:hypothetical protein CWI84_06875 [Idiomarina tyrosinivorans]|uniref:DUF4154 domain-containing protein n=1 Tax=Idiomarina tyrosinivorans TaxID=1445662 RepID=A0A432ZR82_9GAMM|nr:YfiR family protein [Idiomarina tyrosinivorans]RUO80348.1 hypothetical protein CWI84_06875 [Idiomarina tyrosinivorans]
MMIRRLIIAMFACLSLTPLASSADTIDPYLAHIKRLAHFLSWQHKTPSKPFQLCMVATADSAPGLTAERLTIKRFASVAELFENADACAIAYFKAPQIDHSWRSQLERLSRRTLTVGQNRAFLSFGGLIALEPLNQGIKMVVNGNLLKLSDVQLTSQVLEIAEIQ